MLFTDLVIKAAQPRKNAYYLREKGSDRGFCLKVQATGAKAFYLAYRADGKERFHRLGVYPECSLSEARIRCRKARDLVDQRKDPQEIKRLKDEAERTRKREESMKGSVGQLFEHYLDYLKTKKSEESARQVARAYKRDILPVLGADTKAKDVTPKQIKLTLNRVAKRGALILANRTRSYLLAAFRHGIEYDNNPMNLDADVLFDIQHNPARDVPRVVKDEPVGNRDLSKSEIATFWHSLGEYQGMDVLTKLAFKLALATGGQRIIEVTQASWSEFDIDERLWVMPPARTKNRRYHIVPLSDLTLELLADLRVITGQYKHLFPMRGKENKPMRLDSMSKALSRYCERTGFEKFTPRDLRRTCKTRMGELGLSKEIRDRLHNHALTDVSSKHYDRYDYLPEKTKAITAWGDHLEQIISCSDVQATSNVVGIREAK